MFWCGLRQGYFPDFSSAQGLRLAEARPSSTIRKLSISTPSSSMVRLNPAAPSPACAADVGVVAARADVEQDLCCRRRRRPGVITVTSGRWVPPL